MAVVTDMLEEPMSLAWWHTQQDLDLREKKKKKKVPTRGAVGAEKHGLEELPRRWQNPFCQSSPV